MLPKKYRLPARRLFSEIYKKGFKVRGSFGNLVIYSTPSNNLSIKNPKAGVIVSKKIGKAAKRNNFKRWIRSLMIESFSNCDECFTSDKNYYYLYVSHLFPSSFEELRSEFDKQFSFSLKFFKLTKKVHNVKKNSSTVD